MDFQIIAQERNDSALRGAFYLALNDQIKDNLASRDESETLDKLIALAIQLDERLRGRSRVKTMSSRMDVSKTESRSPTHIATPRENSPEPM